MALYKKTKQNIIFFLATFFKQEKYLSYNIWQFCQFSERPRDATRVHFFCCKNLHLFCHSIFFILKNVCSFAKKNWLPILLHKVICFNFLSLLSRTKSCCLFLAFFDNKICLLLLKAVSPTNGAVGLENDQITGLWLRVCVEKTALNNCKHHNLS